MRFGRSLRNEEFAIPEYEPGGNFDDGLGFSPLWRLPRCSHPFRESAYAGRPMLL